MKNSCMTIMFNHDRHKKIVSIVHPIVSIVVKLKRSF